MLKPPSSPRRGRSYSLRRHLFDARSTDGEESEPPSPIEMTETRFVSGQSDDIDIEQHRYGTRDRFSSSSKPKGRQNLAASDSLPNYSSWMSKSQSTHYRVTIKTSLIRARDYILQRRRPLPSAGGRTIPVCIRDKDTANLIDQRTKRRYIRNDITSSIYTAYNFLPRQLIFQFSKLANL